MYPQRLVRARYLLDALTEDSALAAHRTLARPRSSQAQRSRPSLLVDRRTSLEPLSSLGPLGSSNAHLSSLDSESVAHYRGFVADKSLPDQLAESETLPSAVALTEPMSVQPVPASSSGNKTTGTKVSLRKWSVADTKTLPSSGILLRF